MWQGIIDRQGSFLNVAVVILAAHLLLSANAMAGVTVQPPEEADDYGFELSASVSKSKTTAIIEAIQRDKDIRIDVANMAVAAQFAEALSVLSQSNDSAVATAHNSRSHTLSTTASGGSGLLVLNQAAGDTNNQGSSSSVAAVNQPGETIFAEAQVAIGQQNGSTIGPIPEGGDGPFVNGPVTALSSFASLALTEVAVDRSAAVQASLNDNAGTSHVNQSVGNVNNQGNALSLAMGFGSGGVILSDVALGQSNVNMHISLFAIHRTATMTGSIQSNSGIVGVNQAAGSASNQANLVANGIAIIN